MGSPAVEPVRRVFLVAWVALAGGLGGCVDKAPLLHIPDPHPTPLLEEAGDVHVTVGGFLHPAQPSRRRAEGVPDDVLVLEGTAQAAVSPVGHLGVFGAATHVSDPEHIHDYVEAGAVLYAELNDPIHGELLVGRGWGEVDGEGVYFASTDRLGLPSDPVTYVATAALERTFVQGNLWWKLERLRVGTTVRTSRLTLREVESERVAGTFQATYFETSVFVRSTVFEPVSIGARLLAVTPLAEPAEDDGQRPYRERLVSIGVDVALDLDAVFGGRD